MARHTKHPDRASALVFELRGQPGYISGASLTDADLSSVPTNTTFLYLENAQISDVGIASLPDLRQLRGIDLDSTPIGDAALSRISQFLNLEELWVEDTAITDVGLSYLHALRKLRFISILDCDLISDGAVFALERAIPGIRIH